MLSVEPAGLGGAEEELGAVGVGASVGHGEDSGPGVLQLEVLILELVAVDGLAPGAVVVGEVSALAHEVGDHAVEGGVSEAEALLAGTEGAEVLGGAGNHITAELEEKKNIYNSWSGKCVRPMSAKGD